MCAGWNEVNLVSCEINKEGEKTWSTIISIPSEREGLRGLTIDSRVLMIGNKNIFLGLQKKRF